MNTDILNATALYSSLGDDPDMSDLVEMFVEEIPNRIATLVTSYETSDWNELSRTAHQMKGASGSYGFDQITSFAARLETAVKKKEAETEIKEALDELVLVCGKLRSGTA